MDRLLADREACDGFGNCVGQAPDLLEVDDDGLVVALKTDLTPEESRLAQNAVRVCPVRALRLQTI